MAAPDPTLADVDPPPPRDPPLTPADPETASTAPKPADFGPPPSRDPAVPPSLTSVRLASPSAAPKPPPPAPTKRLPRPAAAILGRGGGRGGRGGLGGPVAMGRVSMATRGAPKAAESPPAVAVEMRAHRRSRFRLREPMGERQRPLPGSLLPGCPTSGMPFPGSVWRRVALAARS